MARKKKTKPEEVKPEVPEEVVLEFPAVDGVNNPDLVSLNMICTNVALLQTILDIQVKILAKLNDQDSGKVNAEINTIYEKHRRKALADLFSFDKDS
jgi:hypothetical protein